MINDFPTEEQLQQIEGWIKDLLSGKYKQGIEYLANKNPLQETEFCCLGVACIRAGIPLEDILNKRTSRHPVLESIYGLENDQSNELARMNDAGSTFEEIAGVLFNYVNLCRLERQTYLESLTPDM